MKHFVIILLIVCQQVYAGDSLNLSLPGAPGSYQSDRFRAGELDCSMAIGSGTNLEFGVVGVINNPSTGSVGPDFNGQDKNVGVYGRITIPLGGPKSRVDCTELYRLEMTKKRMEIERLQKELQMLREMKFENK